MHQITASKNTDNNSSTTLSSQQRLLFKLIKTDVWTDLLEKLSLREPRSISITQLTSSNDYQLALRCEDGLRIFQYSPEHYNWQQIVYSKEFCDKNGFNKACYHLQFWKIPQLKKEILICRTQNGFLFADYDTSKHEIRPLAQDSLFPDSGRWYDEDNQLQWGSFYGPDMPLGLFTRHTDEGVRFYILNPNGFKINERPIWEDGNTNKHVQSIWKAKDDRFQFADIKGTGIANIIRQNDEGLSIYDFQKKNESSIVLEELIKTNLCDKNSGWRPGRDNLYFARLTKSQFSNLVLLQSDGLRVYQYVEEKKCFDCLNHDTSMAERFGWNQEHSDSVLFADISGSGIMQLIYAGPQGLTICSFNPDTRKWECNLSPNELNLENKYAVPVMFIPSNRSPTQTPILITKQNGKLNCLTIEMKIVQSNLVEHLLESNLKSFSNSPSSSQEMKVVKSRLIPPPPVEFIVRPKSVAFLRDTLDIKPLLSAVNTYTGKLDFTLPFLSLSTGLNGLRIQLVLRYQGINLQASILGVGWNLVEDYIAVDYQGNVDPLAHRYYWVTGHGSMPLLCQSSQTAHIKSFRLTTSYNLFLIKNLNVNNLPDIQENAIILVGPGENNDYYAYCVQNNEWLRNSEDKHLNKTLIKNIDVNNLGSVEQNGLIKITDKNFKNIVKVIQIATSNENYFDMNITYYLDKQYWEMKTPEGEKRLYGNIQQQDCTMDPIAWTVGWDNWLGIGNDTENQKLYPVRWHLKEIQGYQDDKIIYNYENIQSKVGNQSFTQSMYLKSISDNYNNNIQLIYENKSLEEYEEPVLNDADGNILLSPIFRHYLKTIEINTRLNIQTIQFKYQLHNKIRQLVALSQLEDTCQEPVLKFSYKDFNKSTQLDQICLPSGEKLNFIYQSNTLKHIGYPFDSCSGEYPVKEQPQLTTGPDYLILSEIYETSLHFKILRNNDAHIMNLSKIPEVCMYRAFARQDYFGFIVKKHNNTFALFLYHRRSPGTSLFESKQYSILEFKIQCIDNMLILVNPEQQIIIIHWNNEQQLWQEKFLQRPSNVSQNSQIFVVTNQSLIIVYDDQHLWIGYRDLNKKWQTKLLKHIPNYFSKSKETLSKFEITSTLYEQILPSLKSQVLQSYNNIICLFSWQEDNEKVKSIIRIFMLDSNYNIQLDKIDTIVQQESLQEIFSQFQEREFIKGDKIKYRLMYQKYNGKIRVVFEPQEVIKDIEGQQSNNRRLYKLNNQEISVTIQGIKGFVVYNTDTGEWFTKKVENLHSNSQSLAEYLNEIFLVDLSKYLPHLNMNQIICGNKKWLFNGHQWQEKLNDKNIMQGDKFIFSLGKDYVLHKANKEDSVKLYRQDAKEEPIGDCLYDFKVVSLEDICNAYPPYIAYKQNDNRIFVLPFQKKKLGSAYYLTNGNLTSSSHSQLLVIYQSNSKENKNGKLMIYSNPGLSELYLDPVIVRTSLEMSNVQRNTGYFYHEQSATFINETVIYHKTDLIPGDEKSVHGWIETDYGAKNNQRKIFNSKGQEIFAPLKKSNSSTSKNNSESESLPDPKTTLFLNKTNLEIAQFHNANVQDDEAAYLGFESYEIDNASEWHYKHQNLIKNDWALTGEYYLRLCNKNDFIKRTFNPKNQLRSYQAACWIRGLNIKSLSIDDSKAIIKTSKGDTIGILPATFLICQGEWCYFEINIDLPQIKNNGSLTPIYSANVNDKLCFFQEDNIKIENQQNFEFSVLGISRDTAIKQLFANVHNVDIRSLVSSDVTISFLQNNLPDTMKNKSSYKNIEKKYKQHREKINQCVHQINENIGLKDNQQLGFMNLLEHIKQKPNYKDYYQQLNKLKIISDEIELELENYSKTEDTFKDFIQYFSDTYDYFNYFMNIIDNQTTISFIFDAIAQLNNISLYIWKTNSNNELILLRTNQNKVIKPEQTIHLLYIEEFSQFQKLLDVTNKCLSKEKRESLKQGHDCLLIDLIIQPTNDYTLDIDHIRFTPREQHFYARVYNPLTYQVNALLDGNGSIKYTFYNQLNEPFAVTDWNKYLSELHIHGRSGAILSFGSKLARKQPQFYMTIKPLYGFYEDFSKTSFEERWLINTIANWIRIPGCLSHTTKTSDSLILENEWLDEYSAGLHVRLDLQSHAKIEIKLHKHIIIMECLNKNETNLIVNSENISSLPSYVEYLIITEGNRLLLWANGQLQIDKGFNIHSNNSNHLSLNLTGNVSLSQLFVFSKPAIDIVYKNVLDEELQTIQLEDSQSAIVSQILYDNLGRQTIVAKPTRIIVDDNTPILAFQNDFIENGYTHQNNNVWQTGKLIGKVNKYNPKDEGYCYHEVRYANNPLNEKTVTGQPGRLFTVNEIGCLKYERDAQSSFINLLFPGKDGYSVKVCIQSHGTKHITVFDSHENQIALYVHTSTGNNLLTTYEYDDEDRLVKVLPPIFHAYHGIDTLSQVIPYTKLMTQWQTNEQQRNRQNNFSTRMIYDKHGQIIERITPDTSKQILIYSREKLLRFILQHDINGKPCRVIYHQYDRWGDLSSQGYSTECLSHEDLQNLANNYTELPQAIRYVQMIKNVNSANAKLRSKSITSFINHSKGIWRESSTYLHEGKLSTKEITIFSNNLREIYRTDYTYCDEHISSMTYPMLFKNQPLIIVYSRNKQNRMIAIGTQNNLEQWAKFTYTAHGQMSDEIHISNHFTTHYDYNSPQFLQNIQNSYLKETIYYTEESYGQGGYFDGTIARTQFKALWFNRCDTRLLSLSVQNFQQRLKAIGQNITLENAEYYLQILKNAGFLDENRRVIKAFLPREAALYLPRECGGTLAYALAEILNEYFTQDYGHQYTYGNHMELTKAKYIVGDKSLKPIRPSSFEEECNKINLEQSKSIWKILVDKIYIWPDNDDGIHLQGKVNTDKWIDYETLRKNLEESASYDHLLATILQKYFARREILILEKFQKIFLTWLSVGPNTQPKTIDIYLETANKIWRILSDKGYLYSTNNLCTLFTEDFYQILNDYKMFIPEIVGVLQEHSLCQMGESACDVDAYMIDENGNHHHYWTGYSRYVLHYKENNNQIENIDYKSMSRNEPITNFKIVHDALGNVTKAEHKGITEILYEPASNRTSIIKLKDGRQVLFDYDVQGERVRKYVINNKGEKIKEVLYLRDGDGRSLVEKVIDFTEAGPHEQCTGYIYGPKGLIGFIRNDEFYSVICDHEGSVRLIIKNEEVVAAYDYLPYGNLIRQYGIPQVQISYRYTGQEWDEETSLYNYHARLYDPDIGRFYQIDPQEQYASPYKYAGNSPVSMIDPSGEIAFLPILIIGLAVAGSYLGGSAANNSWNPCDWDLSKPSTYFGVVGGALAGALAPVGFSASAAALVGFGCSTIAAVGITTVLGGAGMYFSMASTNQSWNPTKWQWSRPMTWNGGFQGFCFGASVVGGIGAWQHYYVSLGTAGKLALIASSGTLSIGMAYLNCAAVNGSFSVKKWKWTPGTLFAGLGGAFGGFMAPLGLVFTGKYIGSFQTTNARLFMGCVTVGSGGIFCYLFGSAANNSFNLTNWDMSSPKTYEAMMGGLLFGISLPGLPKALKDAVKNTSEAWKNIKRNEDFRQGEYEPDEKLADKINGAVKSVFDESGPGIVKPSKDGVISIVTTEDGTKFFAYSGSDKNATIYGKIHRNGTISIYMENFVAGVRDGKVFKFDTVGENLGITKEFVWEQSGMPNERGHDCPRAPENCGEPRSMQLAFEAGYSKTDIVSFSTFKRTSTGLIPVNACPNCQVYVPGNIFTEAEFRNPFQNSFDYVVYTAQIPGQRLLWNSSMDLNKKNT